MEVREIHKKNVELMCGRGIRQNGFSDESKCQRIQNESLKDLSGTSGSLTQMFTSTCGIDVWSRNQNDFFQKSPNV